MLPRRSSAIALSAALLATVINFVSCQEEGSLDLSCVSQYACNVHGPNLLGYYNISQEALSTTVQEVSDKHTNLSVFKYGRFICLVSWGIFPNRIARVLCPVTH